MSRNGAATLAQLPASAAAYYAGSVPRGGLFEYHEIGTDTAGRKVYQKTLSGVDYGEPRALLTFGEFKARVKEYARLAPGTGIGVQRWCAVSA